MFELSLMCPEHRVETLCDALDALDALSVSVEDADAQTDAEQALFGEPGMPPPKAGWQRSRVVALYDSQALARKHWRCCKRRISLPTARFWRCRSCPSRIGFG
jgi:ribosomal protein L11 methyltransferase